MKLLWAVVLGYLSLAVLGHIKERRGELTCGCADGCWCKRPPLATFRWVFPVGHRLG